MAFNTSRDLDQTTGRRIRISRAAHHGPWEEHDPRSGSEFLTAHGSPIPNKQRHERQGSGGGGGQVSQTKAAAEALKVREQYRRNTKLQNGLLEGQAGPPRPSSASTQRNRCSASETPPRSLPRRNGHDLSRAHAPSNGISGLPQIPSIGCTERNGPVGAARQMISSLQSVQAARPTQNCSGGRAGTGFEKNIWTERWAVHTTTTPIRTSPRRADLVTPWMTTRSRRSGTNGAAAWARHSLPSAHCCSGPPIGRVP